MAIGTDRNEAPTTRVVGESVSRIGVERFVKGEGRYVGDLAFPGVLDVAFVRSPVAFGNIRSIDLAPAVAPQGPALFAFKAEDLTEIAGPIPFQWEIPTHGSYTYRCLSDQRVLHVGDPVAVVIAQDAYAAREAARRVVQTYDALPALVDPEEAIDATGERILHPELGSNILYESVGSSAVATEGSYPTERQVFDLEAAVEQVAAIPGTKLFQRRFRTNRVSGMPMEPRGCVATFDGKNLTFFTSTQIPAMTRRILADVLAIPESCVEVVAPDVGGGFGIKCTTSREEVAVAALAVKLGRPVRWLESAPEHLENAPQARDEINDVWVAYDDRGKVRGMVLDAISDLGAYSIAPLGSVVEAAAIPVRLPSVYDLGSYTYRVRAVQTTKTTLGVYRGVAAPVGVYVVERILQEIARDVGLDFAEVQRRNLLPDDSPRNAAGIRYDPGQYNKALESTLQHLGYDNWREEQERRRRTNDRHQIGIGLSALVEPSAVAMDGLGLRVVTDWEEAFVRVLPDATVEVWLATSSSGQAHETTFAQIASEVLTLPPQQVRVRENGSRGSFYGSGSWASRVTVVAGGAVSAAAAQVREKALRIAAFLLEVDESTVTLEDGTFRIPDGRAVTMAEVAETAYFRLAGLPPGLDPGLAAFKAYLPAKTFTSPYGFHACAVDVDTLTGDITIRRYVVVSDAGRIVNPVLLDEQVRGGVAQGLGQALLEAVHVDKAGRPVERDLFAYRLPRATDIPDIEVYHIASPTPGNAFGVRGGGEDGPIGAPGAIATAISDAMAPYGFGIDELPVNRTALLERLAAHWEKGGVPS